MFALPVKSLSYRRLRLLTSSRLWLLGVVTLVPNTVARAVSWLPFGPFGGDARSFGADPADHTHLYLGTTTGWVFETHDEGAHWSRISRVGERDNLVIDHLLVDPKNPRHVVAGVWELGGHGGGLYLSNDAGRSWTPSADMSAQSVRSLTSDPADFNQLVAGTLRGVFHSSDAGTHWQLISPPESSEIHEVQSVAVDPQDPKVIYAGTWHLPWKTVDGGAHWTNIKDGIIDDSDVFSIIVDPKSPQIVYASACSGIYRSDNAGAHFVKVQGIPSTARRTRVLKQDPEQLDTVFAGTTEGLFRTRDGGKTWNRTTGPEVIVNDVYVDPSDSKRVLLATERGGVVSSDDGGDSFRPANEGFTARQVVSYAADRDHPATLYVGVINDKEWGGAFTTDNGGLSWVQQSTGLGGRDVFALAQAQNGTIVAATSHGLFRLHDSLWQQAGPAGAHPAVRTPAGHAGSAARPGARTSAHAAQRPRPVSETPGPDLKTALDQGFYALATDENQIYAIGTGSLFTSDDSGDSWRQVPGMPAGEYRFTAVAKAVVLAATLTSIARSTDGAQTWHDLSKPDGLSQLTAVAVDDDGDVWAGGREGLFVLRGGNGSWESPPNLPIRDVNSIFFDRHAKQMLVTVNTSNTLAFALQLPSFTARAFDTGWHMRFIRSVGDHFIGATLYDGVVIQPKMVDSPFAGAK